MKEPYPLKGTFYDIWSIASPEGPIQPETKGYSLKRAKALAVEMMESAGWYGVGLKVSGSVRTPWTWVTYQGGPTGSDRKKRNKPINNIALPMEGNPLLETTNG